MFYHTPLVVMQMSVLAKSVVKLGVMKPLAYLLSLDFVKLMSRLGINSDILKTEEPIIK